MERRLYLDNIRSAYNVGAIFRTADGAGVHRIYLGGYTPQPRDRFGRVQSTIAKTSLGACESMPWEPVPTSAAVATLRALQQAHFAIVVLEQTSASVPLNHLSPLERVVYVVGNEVDGVAPSLIAVADAVVHLPMYGFKESLNVATATGIMLYAPLLR